MTPRYTPGKRCFSPCPPELCDCQPIQPMPAPQGNKANVDAVGGAQQSPVFQPPILTSGGLPNNPAAAGATPRVDALWESDEGNSLLKWYALASNLERELMEARLLYHNEAMNHEATRQEQEQIWREMGERE